MGFTTTTTPNQPPASQNSSSIPPLTTVSPRKLVQYTKIGSEIDVVVRPAFKRCPWTADTGGGVKKMGSTAHGAATAGYGSRGQPSQQMSRWHMKHCIDQKTITIPAIPTINFEGVGLFSSGHIIPSSRMKKHSDLLLNSTDFPIFLINVYSLTQPPFGSQMWGEKSKKNTNNRCSKALASVATKYNSLH